MSQLVYRGAPGCPCRAWWSAGEISQPLPMRRDLRDHSPDGPAWGYGGSGPSQLSLAICTHALRDDARALRVYQDFKWRFVAQLHADQSWQISRERVLEICAEIDGAPTDTPQAVEI